MMSAPARAIARADAMAPVTEGNPAGRYPMSAARPSAAAFSKAAVTALTGAVSPVGAAGGDVGSAGRSACLARAGGASCRAGAGRAVQVPEPARGDVHVLVAAAGQVDQQHAGRA